MKRVAIFALAVVLALGLAGCAGNSLLSKEDIKSCEDMIRAADDFLDGKIDKNEAWERVSAAQDSMAYPSKEVSEDHWLEWLSANLLGDDLWLDISHENVDDLRSHRNELAQMIGMSKRK